MTNKFYCAISNVFLLKIMRHNRYFQLKLVLHYLKLQLERGNFKHKFHHYMFDNVLFT